MENIYKPAGYNSLSAYFVVNGVPKFINFLEKIFNARVLRRYDSPDGHVLHVELLIDDTIIMAADSTDQFPAIHQLVHLYVPDVDLIFQKAKDLHCEEINLPKERPNDPDRRGSFRDFAGNYWSLATQVKKDKG
jgi:PhnB protein